MTDKENFIAHWGFSKEEGERQWILKTQMHNGIRHMAAPMIFVSQDVCYDSPIDGRPITSRAARLDDMARSGCIEYDPEMRKDADRRVKEQEAELDRSVDDYVEREFATMPVRKKEALAAEMQQGITVEPVRQTLGA